MKEKENLRKTQVLITKAVVMKLITSCSYYIKSLIESFAEVINWQCKTNKPPFKAWRKKNTWNHLQRLAPSLLSKDSVPSLISKDSVISLISKDFVPSLLSKDSVPSLLSKDSVPSLLSKDSVISLLSKDSVPSLLSKDSVPSLISKDSVPSLTYLVYSR